MQPTRLDLDMVSGSDQEFEFALVKNSGPANIVSDTVLMYISDGYGMTWRVKKTSSPGSHYNGAGGIVRFTVTKTDVPARPASQVKWYEIWLQEAGGPTRPYIVGEIKATGTVRT